MQAYKAYFERGRFVPLVELNIPEGSRAIVTLLEESDEEVSLRQLAAMARFREEMRATGPLPAEFDEILKKRMSFDREIDL
ncbi:MAG: hypothetical protein FWH47_03330 [Methanomassiliicoccaceae archaeon]|nr:hypothetical protein [Methanomassiliicoccaceae archaeon]